MVELRLDDKLRQRMDASDVVQDAQLEAYRRLEEYLERRPMSFRTCAVEDDVRTVAGVTPIGVVDPALGIRWQTAAKSLALAPDSLSVPHHRLLPRCLQPIRLIGWLLGATPQNTS